uniref:Uncharacterized protein n=1 Tax=uncultured marine virus TaxID=186617 RepID=A0A0F7L9T3_9VIRU|nr:hypothetical protein [uncultured marine virus]
MATRYAPRVTSSITSSSRAWRDASISLINSGGVSSSASFFSLAWNLKKGELGGNNASNSLEARLLTPREPTPLKGVSRRL